MRFLSGDSYPTVESDDNQEDSYDEEYVYPEDDDYQQDGSGEVFWDENTSVFL